MSRYKPRTIIVHPEQIDAPIKPAELAWLGSDHAAIVLENGELLIISLAKETPE